MASYKTKGTYLDLIDQTYYFPQEGFDLKDGYLTFYGVSLKYLIKKYGTPFKVSYLPRIGDQIKKARNLFNRAIKKNNYKGKYHFCYCTKCCHFQHVIKEVISHRTNLETSSTFDIDLIIRLYRMGEIDTTWTIVHNGYKSMDYLEKIVELHDLGFKNSITVLDSEEEIDRILKINTKHRLKIGIRMAINEEPKSNYYTSRLGIAPAKIFEFYKENIQNNDMFEFKMLHFFVDSGIRDSLYYWGEFQKALQLYIELKKISESLDSFNIGGGFPIRNNLGFTYDYEATINQIVETIKDACRSEDVFEPDIYTEFGKYTVGESGAIVFSVIEQKQQNDSELWYLIDNSLMNTIPDAWSIFEKFILLPVNHWDKEYSPVNIGGISCDHSDYYNSEDMNQAVILPRTNPKEDEPLYIGFFHTGAYQDSISGYGGIKHCLIPAPKLIIIDRDEKGNIVDTIYRNEQSAEDMLRILGYTDLAEVEVKAGKK